MGRQLLRYSIGLLAAGPMERRPVGPWERHRPAGKGRKRGVGPNEKKKRKKYFSFYESRNLRENSKGIEKDFLLRICALQTPNKLKIRATNSRTGHTPTINST
jgi:hypothetical protein